MAPATLQEELKKGGPFESPHREAMLNVLRTADLLLSDFERLFRRHGLTSPQYNVLRILRGEGQPLACSEIAQRLVNRMPDITRLVDRLVDAGLAVRTRKGEGRRLVLVGITERGLDLLARLDEPVARLHRRQLGHLAERDLAHLSRLLEAARSNLPLVDSLET